MKSTRSRRGTGLATPTALVMSTLALVAGLLVASAPSADATFNRRCDRHTIKCLWVKTWAAAKIEQFRDHDMPRTRDRRIRPLRQYYKHAWLKKHGPGISMLRQGEESSNAARTPMGWCSGWGDCFERFVDAANCAAHPILTATCLTTDILDDGIGQPEKAELICGGNVLITAGPNPVAVGRGGAGCLFTWLAWQIVT